MIYGNKCDKSVGHRYITLEDCRHIFAVKTLDWWMERGNDAKHEVVRWKCCPICNVPVMKTLRYANITKQIIHDMNEVKKRETLFLSSHHRWQMKRKLSQIPVKELEIIGLLDLEEPFGQESDAELQKRYVFILLATDVLHAHENIDNLMEELCESDTEKISVKALQLFQSHANNFLGWIKCYKDHDKLTDQMILDITAECRRLLLLAKCFTLKYGIPKTDVYGTDQDCYSTVLEETQLTCEKHSTKLSGEDYQIMMETLQAIQMKYRITPVITNESETMICTREAKPDSWYKCPKGHYYNISQCDETKGIQPGDCPECGLQIGSQNCKLEDAIC